MNEFEHSFKAFDGWNQTKKDSFAAQIAGILKNTFRLGHCHTMSVEVWDKAIAPSMETKYKKKRGPYVFLLQSCLEELVEYGKKELPRGERITCIFDENKQVRFAAQEHYTALMQTRGWENILAGATFENQREFTPLQAADMLAYEGYKDVVNITDETPRERRKLLKNLMGSKRIKLAVVDLEGFLKDVEKARISKTKEN